MTGEALIMVVDDDFRLRWVLGEALADEGYEVVLAADAEEALAKLDEALPDLLILDLKMPRMDGQALLSEAKRRDPNLEAVMLTAHGSVDAAVAAIKAGAADFIEKPFPLERLKVAIAKALENQSLRREVLRLRAVQCEREGDIGSLIIGASPQMKEIYRAVRRVASTPSSTLLIQGESGTGKELIARAVHKCSDRKAERFMEINCAALTETLLESELFGYEKGAFTGSKEEGKAGLFEAAHRGTVFLDEIGEMPIGLQAKLLRVLQEKSFKRVGGVDNVEVDVRIVASTNHDLEELVARGEFRLDLYYRLRVVPLHIPPLRERAEDIPLLAKHFLAMFNAELQRNVASISPDAMEALRAYHWPGNVRELKNVIERAVIMASGDSIGPELLLFGPQRRCLKEDATPAAPGEASLAEMEKAFILKALEDCHWHRSDAARMLGITRGTLYKKIRQYGLTPENGVKT